MKFDNSLSEHATVVALLHVQFCDPFAVNPLQKKDGTPKTSPEKARRKGTMFLRLALKNVLEPSIIT